MSSSFTPKSHPEVKFPKLVYGTAWKKERSADLVYQAIKAGFRGIDTAAQPKHYQEKLVGEGIRKAIEKGIVKRADLHIQTKFTSPAGQDLTNMPYDATAPLEIQIQDSITSSLLHLTFGKDEPYIDTLLLHSPLPTDSQTLRAFEILSTYVPTQIRSLGVSNTTLPTLISLYTNSSIPPIVVQNRFYPATNYDFLLRKFCRDKGILFQSFWTLTGNPKLLACKSVSKLARMLVERELVRDEREGKALALYAFVSLGLKGICVLDGTTREERMRGDLRGLEVVEGLIVREWEEDWGGLVKEFRVEVGEVS